MSEAGFAGLKDDHDDASPTESHSACSSSADSVIAREFAGGVTARIRTQCQSRPPQNSMG
jgi:hypothetical protein